MTHQWRGNFYAAFEPRHDQEKTMKREMQRRHKQTNSKKGARTLYCIYSFSRTFHNTLSVPSTRNLARVQIAAPLCRVFANVILCAQSPRRPEIQANRLKTREAVCCNSPASSRTSIDLRFAGFVTGDPIGVSDEKRMPAEGLAMTCLRGC